MFIQTHNVVVATLKTEMETAFETCFDFYPDRKIVNSSVFWFITRREVV